MHFVVFENTTLKTDDLAIEFFDSTVRRNEDGRYVVRLPYLEDPKSLPTHKELAYFRLQSTTRKLVKNPDLLRRYNAVICDQLQKNFIEIVDDEEIADGEIIHYIPHHCVTNDNKSTKLRIVYDGSAQKSSTSKSINNMLHIGPQLMPQLAGVLLRARKNKILVVSDIEKAFLQLELDIRDRDATRFLWTPHPGDKPRCYRFCRVPFGLRSSPFLLNATIKRHLQDLEDPLAQEILRNCYVDNIFYGSDTCNDGEIFYRKSKKIFHDAAMNLCQFTSNDDTLNTFFMNAEAKPKESCNQKLLGIQWNTERDEIAVVLPQVQQGLLTKRRVLQQTASVYDPLGLITPVVLASKLFFQRLWKTSKSWDTSLTSEEASTWSSIVEQWRGQAIQLPRRYFTQNSLSDRFELHVFSDASKDAFGAVAYLLMVSEDHRETSFVMSKSRLAPLKKVLSIPQLELLGVQTAAQLATPELFSGRPRSTEGAPICGVFEGGRGRPLGRVAVGSGRPRPGSPRLENSSGTDSKCSLDILQSPKPSTVFFRNRVSKIKELCANVDFRHIKGTDNPADLLTRGCTPEELRTTRLWWNGPEFLLLADTPPQTLQPTEQVVLQTIANFSEDPVLDPTRFSSFHRLLRVVMTVLYFGTGRKLALHEHRPKALLQLLRLAQLLDPPANDTIASLRLFKKENVWTFTGRIQQKPLPFLPNGHIAKLLVQWLHEKYHHSSPVYTLSKLREIAWIPRSRQVVKNALKSCYGCRRATLKPFYQPDFPPFPESRTTSRPPFENAGVDYAGPLKISNNGTTSSCWIILFTCLSTRFVHCEAVLDLSAVTLLLSLRRLSALFGTPKTLLSDNGRQFVLLNDALREAERQNLPSTLSSSSFPKFRFIPAFSPWAGGAYERLIGLVKTSLLRAGTNRSLLSYEEFRTLLSEASSIINDRPLTYTSSEDDFAPLRPSHMVLPTCHRDGLLTLSEEANFDELPQNRDRLLETWMRTSSLTENYQRRWIVEYPQALQERRDFEHRQGSTSLQEPKIGDVVLIQTPTIKMGAWPLGKIVELSGRSAKVLQGKTRRIIERPLKNLFPLECSVAEQDSNAAPQTSPSTTRLHQAGQTSSTRPTTRSMTMSTTLLLLAFVTLASATDVTQGPKLMEKPSIWSSLKNTIEKSGMIVVVLLILMIIQALATTFKGALVLLKFFWIFTRVPILLLLLTTENIWNRLRRRRQPMAAILPRYRRPMLAIALLVTMPLVVNSTCGDIASITAKEARCVSEPGQTRCSVTTNALLSLTPSGTTACINISTAEVAVGQLTVHAHHIKSSCVKVSSYFTRDYKLLTDYSHRCHWAGSCRTTDSCSSITIDEKLPELSNEAKNSPGFTRCAAGCGCITCSGCFSCSNSCLFFRNYAKATSPYVYEIFHCPQWTSTVEVTVAMNEKKVNVLLRAGIKEHLALFNISLTATSFSLPPSPIHAGTFIHRIKSPHVAFSMTPSSLPGGPQEGTIGDLQCRTLEEAEKFQCFFSERACNCLPQGKAINCRCTAVLLEKYMKKKLPKRMANFLMENDAQGNVWTKTKAQSAVQVHVEMENSTFIRVIQKDKCSAKVNAIDGCFNCFDGAKIQLSCSSTTRELKTAYLNCAERLLHDKEKSEMIYADFNLEKSGITVRIFLMLERERNFLYKI
ncbi:unnamed protein product [Caenorhabditis auriculariae]|uniref:Integrase catalytic domain-containing protein n=1 Tax=Caenorhabditis auriculariae TaxID=2777116 RepID=A0A8S1HLK7_9PELO|nr:unnamed protein product [Caenorhabditis auriculariae]